MNARAVAIETLLSHWRRNPLQLIAMVIGLALATALWSGVQAINAEARDSYARAASLLGADTLETLTPARGQTMPQDVFVALRRSGYLVSPVVEGSILVADRRYRVIGIEPVSMPAAAIPSAVSGEPGGVGAEDPLAFIAPPWRAIASPDTAARLTSEAHNLPPITSDAAVTPDTLIMDIGAAQKLLMLESRISRLLLHAGEVVGADVLTDYSLRRVAPSDANALVGLTDSFHLNLTAFAFLSFAVGLFIVHAAIGLATEQRLAMFRTLRACGLSARGLSSALLIELLLIAFFAGVVGVALGYFIAGALLPDVATSISGLYGVSVSGQLSLSPSWWVSGVLMSVAGALAAVSLSLLTAYRMPPLASSQPEAWRRAQQMRLRWCARGAGSLAAIAVITFFIGGGLEAGFLTIAATLLAAALALPVMLDLLLRAGAAFARGPIVEWAWADMRQQLSGLSLALMALLLALSANVGVGSMVGGFRLTFLDWLDQRLAAEVYVRGSDEAHDRQIADWAAAQPEIRGVLPSKMVETTFRGLSLEVLGVVDHATYRDSWPLIEVASDPWESLYAGRSALVSEQAAFRFGLVIGDELPIGDASLSVAGVYADYGNTRPQIVVSLRWLQNAYPDADRLGIGLRVDPSDASAVIDRLRARFDLPADGLTNQAELKSLATAIFERTFAVTSALNALTLGVAGFALFASMLTLADRRLPQLAPLWSLGLSRRDLAATELAKTLALAFLAACAAIPLGVLLAYLLVAVINLEAFGWRLPLHLFPGQWLRLCGVSILVAVLASAIPILKLRRTPPARLLKVFSDAR